MAAYDILFADPGGEVYYSLATVNLYNSAGYWANSFGCGTANNAPTGRATQYAISQVNGYCTRSFSSNYASWVIGAALYIGSGFTFGSNILMQALDGSTSQVELRHTSGGHLTFTRNGTSISGNSTNALVVGSGWHYVEFKFTINGSTGSAEVRVDGVVWLTVSGVNTQASANAYAQTFTLTANFGSSTTAYWKDVYVMADTGSGPYTTYLGDITVVVLYPNGAGVNSAWTPNGAASDYLCVKDNPASGTAPDGDTTYISSATAGQIADFTKAALSLTGSIYAVIVVSYMRKDDAGSRSAANTLLSGGTESDGATQSLGNTYSYYFDVYEKDPHTSAAWSLTGFNNATFGVKEIS